MPVDHTKNIIEVENASFSYGDQLVLKNITLNVHEGDYLALVGPNGAGKTTLLKMMLGLIRPDTGRVRLFGKDVKDFKDHFKLAYVPQQAGSFEDNFPLTVYDVATLGRYSRLGVGRRLQALDRQVVEKVLTQVNLWPLRERLVGELSGGQKQRLFIARALASEPQVIFLDEPMRGLDHSSQEDLYKILATLNSQKELTLVLVSHDIARITAEAMHIACLDKFLVCHDSPADFLSHSDTVKIFGTSAQIIGPHHHDPNMNTYNNSGVKSPDQKK